MRVAARRGGSNGASSSRQPQVAPIPVDDDDGIEEDEDEDENTLNQHRKQQTGCGRGEHGEVTATTAWWEREIKSRPNLKKFRKGNPEYIGLLHEVAVDGTSAYVPGRPEILNSELCMKG
ncbi:uncharacterized protein [Aegilops tauschii subsp. strangulata]|uniref:uncharacterized protein isoform X3 n=1 Tax=Aegilops tauschii subsp. strangulata TaxID=200361 RepID=UPI003CC85797